MTVESIDNNGNIIFASSTYLKKTATITVTNTNKQAELKKQTAIRVENASLTGIGIDLDDRIGTSSAMAECILEAFDFKFSNGSDWKEGTGVGELDADDILYFTYTVASTNKQIIINSVTFKVPEIVNNAETGNWYRSTATVNKGLTFEFE